MEKNRSKILLKKLFIKYYPKELIFKKQGFSAFPNETKKYLGKTNNLIILGRSEEKFVQIKNDLANDSTNIICKRVDVTNTDETHKVLTSALDLGIDHIDTSDIYGLGISEERIGLFLSRNKKYKEYFKIATKGGIDRNQNGSSRFNNSKKYIAIIRKSTQLLKVI